MFIGRLIAGAAVAALLAGTASAQTSGSTSTTSTTTGSAAAQTGGYSQQPYASPPVTGGAAQPSAASGATAGASVTGSTGATSGASAAYTPIQAVPGDNIIATLKASGEFTKLLAALQATNLTGLISTHPNLTLFAPTDAAFNELPPGQLDSLMKSPAQLQAILTYHLVATDIKEDDVKGHSAGKVSAADNKQLTIDGSGPQLMVNDATVLQPAVQASNGYIYPINKVLTPPTT